MLKIPFLFLVLLSTAFLSACGGGSNPDSEANKSIPKHQNVSGVIAEVLSGGSSLSFNGGSLEGTGQIRFAEPIRGGADTANNFGIAVLIDEGGSVTLVANSRRDLDNGIEIQISRPLGAAAPTVVARIGSAQKDLSAAFAGLVDVTQEIRLWVDVHNDHGSSVHLVLWNQPGGDELVEEVIPGKGMGANWGLKLNGGRVNAVSLGQARDKH